MQQRFFGQPAFLTHPHLVKEGEVTPGITKEEYVQRRMTLVSHAAHLLKSSSIKEHIFIFPSSSKTYMTHDIPYPFRQNTDFLYLCGFQEPDSVLVLHTTSSGYKTVLFVPERNPDKELWDGPRSGREGAVELTGIATASNSKDIEKYLFDYCKSFSNFLVWYNHLQPVHREFHERVFSQFLAEQRHKGLESPVSLMHHQRVVKSAAEIQLIKKSTAVASAAFVEVMKYSYPGISEAHLYAKMDFECRVNGAEMLAYPPVVAGGNRANIIHYINNNQLVMAGDLVLMDAGCEYHGYTSDITRTWPVSGRFDEPQRELYLAVLNIQKACIELCTPDNSIQDIYQEMVRLLANQLISLNIVPADDEFRAAKLAHDLCPHHIGHYLGMDVHDTAQVSKNIKLQPGMVITVEPGIYINENRTDVPEKYRGIGIRIEDDILVTEDGPVNLTEACPKHPDDIEKILAQR